MPSLLGRRGAPEVRGASWPIWLFIIFVIGFIYEILGPQRLSCDQFHLKNEVEHRDLAADLAACQEQSGDVGKCLTPGSYNAPALATDFVQRISHVEGLPFLARPVPLYRPDLRLRRLYADSRWFQLGRLNKTNLTAIQIDSLIRWRSCSISEKDKDFRDLDITCIFDALDGIFFGGALRPHVQGPTWEAQPEIGDCFNSYGGARTVYAPNPITNTTTAHIFLRRPEECSLGNSLYKTVEDNVQQTLQSLLEHMINALFKIYTSPLCNIPPGAKYFLPCLLNRTIGAAKGGPQIQRVRLAIQAAAQPALSAHISHLQRLANRL